MYKLDQQEMHCISVISSKQSYVPLYPSGDFTFAAQNNMFPFTYSLNPSFVIVELAKTISYKRKAVFQLMNVFI